MNNPRRTYWTAALRRSFCALMISLCLGESTRAQIPCRYEITHIIQGPGCSNPSTPSSTFGTAISPDGHWVVGFFNQCPLSENRAFYYDTTTRAFHSIPLGSGFYSSSAEDVNNDGVVVGTGNRTNIGQRGFVYRIASDADSGGGTPPCFSPKTRFLLRWHAGCRRAGLLPKIQNLPILSHDRSCASRDRKEYRREQVLRFSSFTP